MEFIIKSSKHGEFTVLIDDEDSWILNYSWHIVCNRKNENSYYYVQGSIGSKYAGINLSRVIMNVDDQNILVDHWNHNTFDNRKENLRPCTRSENMGNKLKHTVNNFGKTPSSKFKGVYHYINRFNNREYHYWRSDITKNNTSFHKRFPFTPEGELDAAKWYNERAKELHGDFSLLNKIG